jgi:hypothetical protein
VCLQIRANLSVHGEEQAMNTPDDVLSIPFKSEIHGDLIRQGPAKAMARLETRGLGLRLRFQIEDQRLFLSRRGRMSEQPRAAA